MTGEENAAARERVEALVELGRGDDAIRLLGPLLGAAPGDPELLMLMARALLGAGRPDEALNAAEAATAAAPDRAQSHYWRAVAQLEAGQRAVESARTSVNLAPDEPNGWFVLTRAELGRGNSLKAFEAARQTLATAPGAPIGHHALGLVHLKRHEWVEAEADYRAALAISPGNPAYINNLGLALLNQGHSKDAAEFFVRAGEADPGAADLYRRNAAAAGERYLMQPHARLRPRTGLALAVAVFVVCLVFAGGGALVGWAFLLAVVIAVIVTDRVRMRRLPDAARQAVEARRRERHWRNPREWTRGQRRFAMIVAILGVLSLLSTLLSGHDPPATTTPPAAGSPTTTSIASAPIPQSLLCEAARDGKLEKPDGSPQTPADLGCPDA